MYFFELERPVAIVVIGVISVIHSLFHVPHFLMYRWLGILTAFWSLVGVGLIFGAIMEYETFYITWIWYSCIYVTIMLVAISAKLTRHIFELDLKPVRIVLGIVGVLFYLLVPTLQLHSLFHLPHFLMFRRMGIFTVFWSLLGATLIYGAIMEYEFFYAMFVWYSCAYLPVMLITMSIMLTRYIFALNIKPHFIVLGVISICFYLFMLYCVIFVYEEKLMVFTTTTNAPINMTKNK